MATKTFLTAKEAAAELGVKIPTLYAYVSRGLIRSEMGTGRSRAKRYRRADIETLKARKALQKEPSKAVASALHWGTPLLESQITLIANGRLYYRGQDALKLSQTHTFEAVAALIWQIENPVAYFAAPLPAALAQIIQSTRPMFGQLTPVELFQVVLTLSSGQDLAAYDLHHAAIVQTGARMLRLETAVVTNHDPTTPIANAIQSAWTPAKPEVAQLINAALIACADHELNVSAFTARVVASAEATPYQAVIAALAALQGRKHGGYTERVAAFFREIGSPQNSYATIANRLKRGERIPGFGHPLYPDGDPRAQMLLAQTKAVFPQNPAYKMAQEVCQIVAETTGLKPTIDFALVTLALAANLPPHAPLALFAIGRTAGWVGHIIEQYAQDQLIRPRARYTGPTVADLT